MLQQSPTLKFNLNLKKMSERGAPLLYFMIKNEKTQLIKLLVEAGASPFVSMQDDDDEVSFLFSKDNLSYLKPFFSFF